MRTARLSLVLALALLVLAVSPATSAVAATASPPKVEVQTGSVPATSGCVYHVVRYGETLSSIARNYGTTSWNIAQLNRLRDVNWIWPGQRLLIYPCRPPSPRPPAPPPSPPSPPPPPACAIQPILGFGRVWTNNPSVRGVLGCPTVPERGLALTAQRYQNGWLWFNQTFGRWELLNSQSRTWSLYDNEAGARAASGQLGTALTGPFIVTGTYQFYGGGTMVWTPATGIIVFYNNGTWASY